MPLTVISTPLVYPVPAVPIVNLAVVPVTLAVMTASVADGGSIMTVGALA